MEETTYNIPALVTTIFATIVFLGFIFGPVIIFALMGFFPGMVF